MTQKRSRNNENLLKIELGRLFKNLEKEVLQGLNQYWSDYQLRQGHIDLMLAPVHEAHKEYYAILEKHILKEYELGKAEARRMVNHSNLTHVAFKSKTIIPITGFIKRDDKEGLFGTIPAAEQSLLNNTFKASENTISRIDNNLNQIITEGYKSGYGINQIRDELTRRFDQLSSWEAQRIARTEVHNAHNKAIQDTYKDMCVEYTQWIAAGDDRTRDSHVEIDGEIIPVGETYSNGLRYPGDTSGPLEEWINCRCSHAPFVVPVGYEAPSFSPFREDDLVRVELPSVEEVLGQGETMEPSPKQIKQNLTKKEQKQLEFFERSIKESEQWLINNQNVTSKQKEAINKMIKQKTIKINKLKEKAIGKTKSEPTKAPSKSREAPVELARKTIKDLHKEVKMPTEELIPTIQKWAKKRFNNKVEYGYQFDINTGKLITPEIRGKKGGITFTENGKNIGSVHTHPPEQGSVGGGSFPSAQDIKTYRAQAGTDHFVASPNEIWYIHAEEELGLQQAQFFTQREIDKTFEEIYKDVEKEGKELVKKGELKTDNESIRLFLEEEIGNMIIKEFSKPEWREKGFIIERYYYD